MNTENQINYWLKSAEHDLVTTQSLFEAKHYDWRLFLSHLVIEKTLKALNVKINYITPPRIHDLTKLAELSNLKLDNDKINQLEQINDFNIEARYPDEKFNFYKISDIDLATTNYNYHT